MTPDEELILELKKLNRSLSGFSHFWAGFFRSLGNFVGTLVVTAIIVYFLSRLNLNQIITDWFQGLIRQIQPQFSL